MRIFVLVIDSFGIGYLPDAHLYGDEKSNTAVGIGRALGGVDWPNLQAMGLGNAAALLGEHIPGCPPQDSPNSIYGVMKEKSPGKDTTTGHWELAGLEIDQPLHLFPGDYPSFPNELIEEFVNQTGVPGILGNKAASGTLIIEELGVEHMRTGKPICYTSADSVFQIATHSDIFPKDELYRLCEVARKLCDSYKVGRVIARPFEGVEGAFQRTRDRHDWSIELPGHSLLYHLQEEGVQTVAIGKIGSIFNEQGIDVSWHDAGNTACLERVLQVATEPAEKKQFVFVNLVDTDMIYGHRRDAKGYHDAVAVIDAAIPKLTDRLDTGDAIVITADHGCDPTFKGTDHTREHVPMLWYVLGSSKQKISSGSVGIRESFADLSASIQMAFSLPIKGPGVNFFF